MAPVINMVMMPVLLLCGILLPMTIGPDWLQRPATSCRSAGSPTPSGGRSPATSSKQRFLWGTAWAVALFALAVWWGTSTFRKENT